MYYLCFYSYSAETFEEVDLSDPENDSLYDGFETVSVIIVESVLLANCVCSVLI